MIQKQVKIARINGFTSDQIYKITGKVYSHKQYISIHYYSKYRIPVKYRQFLK